MYQVYIHVCSYLNVTALPFTHAPTVLCPCRCTQTHARTRTHTFIYGVIMNHMRHMFKFLQTPALLLSLHSSPPAWSPGCGLTTADNWMDSIYINECLNQYIYDIYNINIYICIYIYIRIYMYIMCECPYMFRN